MKKYFSDSFNFPIFTYNWNNLIALYDSAIKWVTCFRSAFLSFLTAVPRWSTTAIHGERPNRRSDLRAWFVGFPHTRLRRLVWVLYIASRLSLRQSRQSVCIPPSSTYTAIFWLLDELIASWARWWSWRDGGAFSSLANATSSFRRVNDKRCVFPTYRVSLNRICCSRAPWKRIRRWVA